MPITTTQAAERLGVTPQRVRDVCHKLEIGQMIGPRCRVLDDADFNRLSNHVGQGRHPAEAAPAAARPTQRKRR